MRQLLSNLLYGALIFSNAFVIALPASSANGTIYTVIEEPANYHNMDGELQKRAGWVTNVMFSTNYVRGGSTLSAISRASNTISLFLTRQGAPEPWEVYWQEGFSNWKTSFLHGVLSSTKGWGPITGLSRRPDRQEVFWIQEDYNNMRSQYWKQGDGWSSSNTLKSNGLDRFSRIAAVSRDQNSMEIFFINNQKQMVHSYCNDDGKTWYIDNVLDPNANAMWNGLGAVSRNYLTIDLFWITASGGLNYGRLRNGQWSTGIILLNGVHTSSGLAVVARSAVKMNIFYIGTDFKIWQLWWNDNQPDVFHRQKISDVRAYPGAITAVSMNSYHLEVFWTKSGGAIHHAYYTEQDGQWRDEQLPGSSANSGVSCNQGDSITSVSRQDKTIEGFCRGPQGQLIHFYYYA